MKKTVTFCLMLLIHLSLFANGQQSTDGTVTMRVGDIENVANLGAIAMDRYEKLIETKSEGTIDVKCFHASQMGSANKQLEMVKSGTLEAFRGSISWLAQFDTGFSLTDFPFCASSSEQAKMIVNSSALSKLNDKLAADHGIRFVTAGWTRLPRQVLVSEPVNSPQDLDGIKLRVPECYSYIKSFKALGVAPTPVAFSETYLALKQGVVDGAENHVESLYNMKWYESAKHLVITDHSYDTTGFIVNDAWWQSLSDEDKNLITRTWDEVEAWFIVESENLQNKYIDMMKAEGVEVHNIDKAAFRSMVYPKVMIQAETDGEWDQGLWGKMQSLLEN